jgi:hypothetical protein
MYVRYPAPFKTSASVTHERFRYPWYGPSSGAVSPRVTMPPIPA